MKKRPEEIMSNLILIGMPAAGKSTVGVILAKLLGYCFIDTDLLIQSRESRRLREIIADRGVDGFLAIEEDVCLSIRTDRCVILQLIQPVFRRIRVKFL